MINTGINISVMVRACQDTQINNIKKVTSDTALHKKITSLYQNLSYKRGSPSLSWR